jgi:hypothetical protein
MPKRISIYVLLLVSLGVFLSHVSIAQKDNGFLLVIDGREVDALGIVQDKWVRLTRQCERISNPDASSQPYLEILKTIKTNSPPSSETAEIVSLSSVGEWSLAQVRFKALLPAVVLIQEREGAPSIVQNAIWSGQTSPWQAGHYIRQYIAKQAPKAPKALLECFDRLE